jgi:glutaredoxin 3
MIYALIAVLIANTSTATGTHSQANTLMCNSVSARNANSLTHIKKGRSDMNNINITMYTKANCPNCETAKMVLSKLGLKYADVDVEVGERMANLLKEFPDARQMPQIFFNDQRIGGLAGLQAALKQLGAVPL